MPLFQPHIPPKPQIGVVNGLGVQVQDGGMLLCVEALLQRGGSGLTVTGILEEEEIKSRQGSARRKRNARSAAENALTLLEQFGFWQTALYLQAGKTDPFPLRRQKIDKFSFLPLPRGRSA